MMNKISESVKIFLNNQKLGYVASVSKDGKEILAQRNWETESYEYGHIVKISLE